MAIALDTASLIALCVESILFGKALRYVSCDGYADAELSMNSPRVASRVGRCHDPSPLREETWSTSAKADRCCCGFNAPVGLYRELRLLSNANERFT